MYENKQKEEEKEEEKEKAITPSPSLLESNVKCNVDVMILFFQVLCKVKKF